MPALPSRKRDKPVLIRSLAEFDRLYFPKGLEIADSGTIEQPQRPPAISDAQVEELRSRLRRQSNSSG